MAATDPPLRLLMLRGGLAVVVVAPVLAVLAYLLLPAPAGSPVVLQPVPKPPAASPPSPAPAPQTAPTFDVVRVSPNGSAVIAGRADPGAQIIVRDGGKPIGEVKADNRGEWVLLPLAPLPPGGRELTVASRLQGLAEVGGDSVILSVPEPWAAAAQVAAASEPAPVVLVPKAGTPRILGTPDLAARPGGTALGLGTVDYDDGGDIRFAGVARPGAQIRLYVDNTPAGDAVADPQGRWSISPRAAVAAGLHRLRLDQLTGAGRVQARVEVPFQRSSLPASDLANGRVVVQPGQTLWRLARSAYGSGVRYTVIYLANRDQIRDPHLIYPGQAFALPDPPGRP